MKIQINSSAIKEVEYNARTKTLTVIFTNKTVYDYLNIPKHIIDELINADSKGRYYNFYIRNQFEFIKQ